MQEESEQDTKNDTETGEEVITRESAEPDQSEEVDETEGQQEEIVEQEAQAEQEEIVEREEEEEEYDGERFVTVSLFPTLLSTPTWQRSSKAVKVMKEKIQKHVKYVEDPLSGQRTRIERPVIKVSPQLNEQLHTEPRKIRVKVNYKILDPERGRVRLDLQAI